MNPFIELSLEEKLSVKLLTRQLSDVNTAENVTAGKTQFISRFKTEYFEESERSRGFELIKFT